MKVNHHCNISHSNSITIENYIDKVYVLLVLVAVVNARFYDSDWFASGYGQRQITKKFQRSTGLAADNYQQQQSTNYQQPGADSAASYQNPQQDNQQSYGNVASASANDYGNTGTNNNYPATSGADNSYQTSSVS